MSRRPSSLQALFAELKRRHVFRVMAVYGAVAFVILQIADLAFEPLGLPQWTMTFVLLLSMLGFPVAIVLAWAFEQTPEGIRRTEKAAPEEIEALVAEPRHRRWPAGIAALVGVALLVAGAWWMGRSGAGAASGDGDAEAGARSIAVLPLTTRIVSDAPGGGEDRAVVFADGMHDDLLTVLSRISDLRVTSRTSVEKFRDTDEDVRDIAAQLGVRYVLEGAVDRVGDNIRVNVQLIDARSDGHVWAEKYDETMTLDNLFAIRDDLTRRIASSLRATLSPAVEAKIDERPTDDPEAFELYTRARHLYDRGARPDLERAIELLGQAIDRDPQFAAAYAALGAAHGRMIGYGFVPVAAGVPRVRAAVQRALELEPDNAEGLMVQARLELNEGAIEAARRTLDRVIQVNPSYAAAYATLASLEGSLGYDSRQLEAIQRAAELDPLSADIRAQLVDALSDAGRVAEATGQASQLLELHPDFEPAADALASAMRDQGRSEEAVEVLRQALRRNPASIFTNENLAWLLLKSGARDEALAQIERAAELTPDDYPTQGSLSAIALGAGRYDESLAAARRMVRLAPENLQARTLLTEALLAVGDTGSANAQIDTALSLPPSTLPGRIGDALQAMVRVGRVEDAVDFSRRVVEARPGSVYQLGRHARFLFEVSPWAANGPEAGFPMFDRARQLSPHEDHLLINHGTTLRELGRSEEALAQFHTLVAEQPGDPSAHMQLGWELLIGQRDDAAAERAFRRALQLDPERSSALWGLARIEARAGRADSAFALIERVETVCSYPGCPDDFRVREAWLRAVAGDEAGARDLLARYEGQRDNPSWADWLPVFAVTHAELGETDEAFRQLDLAYELRSSRLLELKVEPWFDPLRDDPRFDALRAKMGFD